MKIKILIVEDQSAEANNLKLTLRKAGYHVCTIATTVAEALTVIAEENPDLALLDIQLKGKQTGIDLARILAVQNRAFVYLSANSDIHTLTLAKATQPYGFLLKPFRHRDVLVTLDVALYLHRQKQELPVTAKPLTQDQQSQYSHILGKSPAMKEIFRQLEIVSQTDTSVLILGESGTGKELVANALHHLSKRNSKPFVAVNCSALPPNLIESILFGHEKGAFTGAHAKQTGKFEQADGGTIFLDEIGEMPIDLQSKLLRVLQEREIEPIGGTRKTVNVRIIAATNRNLQEEMANGRFRMDLYYRLNVFPITLPPLRERPEDILPLAQHFITRFAKRENKTVEGLTEEGRTALLQYTWPGNIRELENIMERSVLLCSGKWITPASLPAADAFPLPHANGRFRTISENERDHIIAALHKTKGKIFGPDGAAELLEINGSTLQSRMKKLGIGKNTDTDAP